MGEHVSFTAALKKGDQGDILVLTTGEEIRLPTPLPYGDGEDLTIHISPRQNSQTTQDSTLAKQILQEILDGD